MKIIFLPVKYKKKINFNKIDFSKLPKEISICYTVQFSSQVGKLKEVLNKKGIKIINSFEILGCSDLKPSKEKAFLYIGTGKFHPINVALKTGKKVFIFNPVSESFSLLSEKEVERYNRKIKANKLKYNKAKKIGILVSTKPGQNNLGLAKTFLKKIEKKGKQGIIFISDFISLNELENFPEIECWANTACPRILDDVVDSDVNINLINIDDLN